MRNKLRPKEIAKRRLLWEIAVGKKSEIPAERGAMMSKGKWAKESRTLRIKHS